MQEVLRKALHTLDDDILIEEIKVRELDQLIPRIPTEENRNQWRQVVQHRREHIKTLRRQAFQLRAITAAGK